MYDSQEDMEAASLGQFFTKKGVIGFINNIVAGYDCATEYNDLPRVSSHESNNNLVVEAT